MAACDSCGAALTPGAATCDLCGTPVGRPDATPVEGGMPACPNCGHHPPVGSTFCNACGEPLPATLGHASDGARPPVAVPVRPDPASNAVGTRAMVVIGVGLLVVVALYGLTVLSPRNVPVPVPADEPSAVGPALDIPPGAPALPDTLQAAADRLAGLNTADGFYESGRYYLTAAFQLIRQDPQDPVGSVRFARRAIEEFEKSLAIADDPRVRVALAEAATFDPSDPMRPIQELRTVLGADPDNLDAIYLLAERRMMIGRVDSARTAFQRIVAEAPVGSLVRERAQRSLAELDAAGG